MPESFVQVAPNSTGAKLRTHQRTVGTNTVEMQHVIAHATDAAPINRVWLTTLRIPQKSVTAPTAPAVANSPLFSIWNGIATGGNSVSIRRLSVEIDVIASHAGASPILRMYRQTAASTGGTLITPVNQYLSDPALSTLVAIRADHGTDNVSAGTALTSGTVGTQPMWSQTIPRAQGTIGGFQPLAEYNLIPNDSALNAVDPLILRPGEGIHIRSETTIGLAATIWTYAFKAVLAEFTYP